MLYHWACWFTLTSVVLMGQTPNSKVIKKPEMTLPLFLEASTSMPPSDYLNKVIKMEPVRSRPYVICLTGDYRYKPDKADVTIARECTLGGIMVNDGPPSSDPKEVRKIEIFTRTGKIYTGTMHLDRIMLENGNPRWRGWTDYEWYRWSSSNILIDTDEELMGFRLINYKGKMLIEKVVLIDDFKQAPTIVINGLPKAKPFMGYYSGRINNADSWNEDISLGPEKFGGLRIGIGDFKPIQKSLRNKDLFFGQITGSVHDSFKPGWPIYLFVAYQGLNAYAKIFRSGIGWIDDPTIWDQLRAWNEVFWKLNGW